MTLLRPQSLSRLVKRLQQLVLRLMLVIPLLTGSGATSLILFKAATANAAQDSADFSPAQLDQMLAPIALYPDALLSQVLIASTYPLEVIQADRWVRSNKDLKADDALKFAENKDWDPSVKALVAFPDILQRMSDDVDWTQSLGDAFLTNEGDVMDSVQRLRKRAYASGNLEKAQHISVERDDNNIIIEPAQERIVYVPVYDTRVVYGNWWWPDYPPVYWHYPSSYTYVSGFYWGSSIYLGSSYFYSSCHWRDRRVVVIDRHSHYGADTRFYTGRSIIRSGYSRNWSHDPVHRQGVAYYNNRLRDNYASPRPSYQHDRQYREQYRDAGRDSGRNDRYGQHHNSGGTGNQNNANNRYESRRADQFDRAEQVRERLNNTHTSNNRGGDSFQGTNSNSGWVNNTEQNGARRATNNLQSDRENRAQNRPNTTTTNFALPSTGNRNAGAIDVRNDDSSNRQRAALQEQRANAANERINPERRFNRDSAAQRTDFSGTAVRTEPPPRAEPRAEPREVAPQAPQAFIDRRPDTHVEAPREAAPSPQRTEGLAEQRAARAENSNSRFAR